MKKLFLYMFLGLLWCNISIAESVKDMKITCSSNDYSMFYGGEDTTDTNNHVYEINIINDTATLVHSTKSTYFRYENIPLNNITEREYYFYLNESTETLHRSSKIKFNRINATGHIAWHEYSISDAYNSSHFEASTLNNCKPSDIDDKPKF